LVVQIHQHLTMMLMQTQMMVIVVMLEAVQMTQHLTMI
jgi:hypothetical protein